MEKFIELVFPPLIGSTYNLLLNYPLKLSRIMKLGSILSGTPLYPKAHIVLTLVFFIVWCLVGYLLPEDEWDRSKDGVWGGYKGKSNYCEEIRHAAAKYNPKNKMTFKNNTSNSTSAFMAQPVNSLSNYTFVAYGFIVLSLFWSDALEASRVASSSTTTTSTTPPTTTTTTTPSRRRRGKKIVQMNILI